MTTIHGDPDMYVSRIHEYPSKDDFEKRGTRCGKFPEIVIFSPADTMMHPDFNDTEVNLKSDYFIGINGAIDSVYSIVFNVERTDRSKPIFLSEGLTQRGVLAE